MKFRSIAALLVFGLSFNAFPAVAATVIDVEIVQVCNNAGLMCALLDPNGGGAAYTAGSATGYVYENDVNTIWAQAGLSVNFIYTTWNNSAALDLSGPERTSLYADTWLADGHAGPAPPSIIDGTANDDRALQFFFVDDHPGTASWAANPLPSGSGRNAGNAQLGVVPMFSTNGRGVMANEGATFQILSGTLAHEMGHALGLRHIDDTGTPMVDESGGATGASNDPIVDLPQTTHNLMWEGGSGPANNTFTSLTQFHYMNADQAAAAIENGIALGILAVPEPSAFAFLAIVMSLSAGCARMRKLRSISVD